jgi:hypothetical protein
MYYTFKISFEIIALLGLAIIIAKIEAINE